MRGRIIRRSRVRLGLLVVVAAAVLLTVLVGSSAALPSGGCVFTAATGETVCTFSYTGAAELWQVPVGVTSATFEVDGAAGAASVGTGGLGGRATATMVVTPGQVLQVNVGGAGSGFTGGFNGGGAGGHQTANGGGGGGASDVRSGAYALADRLIVGGGGGGAGSTSSSNGPANGGAGGGLVGGDGIGGGPFASPGHGGTQTQGGAAGTGVPGAQAGALGVGGAGFCDGVNQCGGGGGGGLYGGGGANVGDGGGGGSGYGPAGVVFQSGVRSGNGQVTVTYGSALDQLSALLTEVNGLTPKSTRAKLAKTLNRLIGHVIEDETNHACKDLATFIRQVHAAKKLTHDERASLTAQAHIIEATLGC